MSVWLRLRVHVGSRDHSERHWSDKWADGWKLADAAVVVVVAGGQSSLFVDELDADTAVVCSRS